MPVYHKIVIFLFFMNLLFRFICFLKWTSQDFCLLRSQKAKCPGLRKKKTIPLLSRCLMFDHQGHKSCIIVEHQWVVLFRKLLMRAFSINMCRALMNIEFFPKNLQMPNIYPIGCNRDCAVFKAFKQCLTRRLSCIIDCITIMLK